MLIKYISYLTMYKRMQENMGPTPTPIITDVTVRVPKYRI